MIKNTSETKTENLLRDFYGSKTFVEKSAIPTVYGFKSKKGTKYKGYPDFFWIEKIILLLWKQKQWRIKMQ